MVKMVLMHSSLYDGEKRIARPPEREMAEYGKSGLSERSKPRRFLKYAGIAALSAYLSACSGTNAIPASPTPAQQSAPQAAFENYQAGSSGSNHANNPASEINYLESDDRFVSSNRPAGGFLENVSCDEISGWAIDWDDPYTSIWVHIYMDGPAGSREGKLVGAALAYRPRPDVGYNAGFSLPTPNAFKNGKAHTVFVHAIDIDRWGNVPGWPNEILHDIAEYKNPVTGITMPGTLVCPPRLTVKE